MVQIEPLIWCLTFSLTFDTVQALSITVTIVIETIDVYYAFVIVSLTIRYWKLLIALALVKLLSAVIVVNTEDYSLLAYTSLVFSCVLFRQANCRRRTV